MRCRRPAGFTLLELMIVLLLISIVLAISSVSLVSALNSSKLESTADDLSSSLRRARALAALKGKKEDVLIDLDSRSFGIERQGNFEHIPSGINIKTISITGEDLESGIYRVTYYPSGAVEGPPVFIWNKTKWYEIAPDPVIGCTESSGRGGAV